MGTRYAGKPSEVRALDAYIKLMRATNTVQGNLDRKLLAQSLTENQFGVLEMLLHLGPLTQRDIGVKLFTSNGNVTVVVDNLEKRYLVRRVRDRADRRLITVHLTPEGRRLIEWIFPGHVAAVVGEFSRLTAAEQEELGRLCKKLGLRDRRPGPRRADQAGQL
jgi:MarR family transcriptional regulator, 2-MHQ and catechol-resistance regulon repressor